MPYCKALFVDYQQSFHQCVKGNVMKPLVRYVNSFPMLRFPSCLHSRRIIKYCWWHSYSPVFWLPENPDQVLLRESFFHCSHLFISSALSTAVGDFYGHSHNVAALRGIFSTVGLRAVIDVLFHTVHERSKDRLLLHYAFTWKMTSALHCVRCASFQWKLGVSVSVSVSDLRIRGCCCLDTRLTCAMHNSTTRRVFTTCNGSKL